MPCPHLHPCSGRPALMLFGLFLACSLLHAQAGKKSTALDAARKLHERCNYAQAMPLLRKIVQQEPANYDAALLLGDEQMRTGARKEALATLRAAANLHPHEPHALLLLAEDATRMNNFSLAAESLEEALAQDPKNDEALLAWADFSLDRAREIGIALRKSRRGEAVMLRIAASNRQAADTEGRALLAEAVNKDSTDAEAQSAYGLALLAHGEIDEAAKHLQLAVQLAPQLSSTLELQAKLSAVEDRWQDAAALLHQLRTRSASNYAHILRTWPAFIAPGPQETDSVWNDLRTGSLTAQAEPQSLSPASLFAQQAWDSLRRLTSSNSAQPLWIGIAQAADGNCPPALPLLESSLDSDPFNAAYWLQLCYARAGSDLVGTLSSLHHQAALLEVRGDMQRLLANDAAAAMPLYLSALQIHPNHAPLLAKLADAYQRTERATEAKTTAQQALALDPRNTAALRVLAQSALRERDYQAALNALLQLLQIEPADDWARVQTGKAYAQSGENEKALTYLVDELNAGYPDTKGALHAIVAATLRKLGRNDEAAHYAAQAAQLSHKAESDSAASSQP